MPDPATALAEFVTYVETHLTGDEKGEAADFLDLVRGWLSKEQLDDMEHDAAAGDWVRRTGFSRRRFRGKRSISSRVGEYFLKLSTNRTRGGRELGFRNKTHGVSEAPNDRVPQA